MLQQSIPFLSRFFQRQFHSKSTRRCEKISQSLRDSGGFSIRRRGWERGRTIPQPRRTIQKYFLRSERFWPWSNVISSIFAPSGFRQYRKYPPPDFLWFWHRGGSRYFFASSLPPRRWRRIVASHTSKSVRYRFVDILFNKVNIK